MINVTFRENVNPKTTAILDPNTTVRAALESQNINYADGGMILLDGSALPVGSLDKTFAELNITDKCYLFKVKKVDNAVCITFE